MKRKMKFMLRYTLHEQNKTVEAGQDAEVDESIGKTLEKMGYAVFVNEKKTKEYKEEIKTKPVGTKASVKK